MRYILALLFALLAGPVSAADNMFPTPGNALAQGVVNMCWSGTNAVPCSVTTPLQIAGSFSASLGGFTPSASGARGTPVSVTTSDSSGTLPTGAVVAVTNVGANPMYCNVNGIAATTSDQYISTGGGWFAFTIPAAITTLHCIATGSSTTANMVGGSGLPTGTGGGGGSGGGGAVTVANGADTVEGTITTAHGCSVAGYTVIGCLGQIDDDVKGPIPAQAASVIIGGVGVPSWAGGTLGAMANYGTSPGAVLVPGVNAFITNIPAVSQSSQYPSGATAITASTTGTTAATTATLAGTSGKTTYLCSYSIRANATAAATVTNTITGVITGTLSHIMWVAPLASGLGVDEQIFNPCVPASSTNTGIAVVSGAPGAGGSVSATATGYQL